jgi:hypothetical protein
MHERIAYGSAPERNESERGRPSMFHEESTGSGTMAAGREPGRNVCVLTIAPMLHFGQLSLYAAALVVSETAWG